MIWDRVSPVREMWRKNYRDGVGVVNQQSNTWCFGGIFRIKLNASRLFCFPLFLKQLLIELDEQQSLVADIREEVILPNEVKDVGPP